MNHSANKLCDYKRTIHKYIRIDNVSLHTCTMLQIIFRLKQ